MKKPKLKNGTKVQYFDRQNNLIGIGVITGCPDTKNGMTIYDVTLKSGLIYWGYREQFVPIESKS